VSVCCLRMQEAMSWGDLGFSRRASDVIRQHVGGKFVGESGTLKMGIRTEVVSKSVSNEVIGRWHRHLGEPHMGIVGVLAYDGDVLVGAANLATPTARTLMRKGTHLEVNRIATVPDGWYDGCCKTLRFNAVSKMTKRLRHVARRLREEARIELDRARKRLVEDLRQRPVPAGWNGSSNGRQIGLFPVTPRVCPKEWLWHHQGEAGGLSRREWRRYERRENVDRLRTYIFDFEDGASLRAGGWKQVGMTRAGSWNWATRPRREPRVKAAKVQYDIMI